MCHCFSLHFLFPFLAFFFVSILRENTLRSRDYPRCKLGFYVMFLSSWSFPLTAQPIFFCSIACVRMTWFYRDTTRRGNSIDRAWDRGSSYGLTLLLDLGIWMGYFLLGKIPSVRCLVSIWVFFGFFVLLILLFLCPSFAYWPLCFSFLFVTFSLPSHTSYS